RLWKVILILDLKSYAFTIKKVKYLSYIIEVGAQVYLDLEKLVTICDFLGFANFYRDFIPNFSRLIELLI
ncbi:hypothetical protein MYCTH_2066299, partial [Thermothelomyces thermophilus ATCC 42464]